MSSLVALTRAQQGTQHDVEGHHISFPQANQKCVGDAGLVKTESENP